MKNCSGQSIFQILLKRQAIHWAFYTEIKKNCPPHIKSSCYKSLVVPVTGADPGGVPRNPLLKEPLLLEIL